MTRLAAGGREARTAGQWQDSGPPGPARGSCRGPLGGPALPGAKRRLPRPPSPGRRATGAGLSQAQAWLSLSAPISDSKPPGLDVITWSYMALHWPLAFLYRGMHVPRHDCRQFKYMQLLHCHYTLLH